MKQKLDQDVIDALAKGVGCYVTRKGAKPKLAPVFPGWEQVPLIEVPKSGDRAVCLGIEKFNHPEHGSAYKCNQCRYRNLSFAEEYNAPHPSRWMVFRRLPDPNENVWNGWRMVYGIKNGGLIKYNPHEPILESDRILSTNNAWNKVLSGAWNPENGSLPSKKLLGLPMSYLQSDYPDCYSLWRQVGPVRRFPKLNAYHSSPCPLP